MDSRELLWLGLTEEECRKLGAARGLELQLQRTREPNPRADLPGLWRVIRAREEAGRAWLLLGFFALPPAEI